MSPSFRLKVLPDDGIIDTLAIELVVSGVRLVALRWTERTRLGTSDKTIQRICRRDSAHRPAYARR